MKVVCQMVINAKQNIKTCLIKQQVVLPIYLLLLLHQNLTSNVQLNSKVTFTEQLPHFILSLDWPLKADLTVLGELWQFLEK